MRKKAYSILLAVVMLFSIQAAYGDTFTMAGFDGQNSNHNWSTNHFFQRMQDQTGISFEFDQYSDSQKWHAAKDAMFASGELPDVLFKAALSVEEQMKYSEEGLLIDLLPLLEDYAPNLWALLQANPEWLAAITLPDGMVIALPTINLLPLQNAMWINQTWLDTLNLEAPTNFEELQTVLSAFQTEDPNRNGKKDEIPLSFLGPWDLKFLAHGFGLAANDYNIYVDEAGNVQFLPLQDKFIDFIKALASLYRQGLLDDNGFSTADALRSITDSDADVTYGMFFGPNPFHLLTVELGGQYTLLEPLVYQNEQIYRDIFGPITGGTFAITSVCPDPGTVLGWVDILYTQEGAISAMVGIEGEDYKVDSDGIWEYAVDLQTESSYILYDLSIYDTGSLPWMFPVEFFASYETDNLRETTEALVKLQSYAVSPFPYYYVLSDDQRKFLEPLQLALGKYVDESIAKFILGELNINSLEDIQAFYNGLAEHNVQDFVFFWQDIYNQQLIR